jgi:hypothetical protein
LKAEQLQKTRWLKIIKKMPRKRQSWRGMAEAG